MDGPTHGLRLAVATCLLAGQIAAAVPVQITAQGVLQTTGGPSVDGSYEVTFSLYDGHPATGVLVWSEVQGIEVVDGVFTASLPHDPSLGWPPGLFAEGKATWLTVSVDGAAAGEPVRLTSVPYAHSADAAAVAFGLQCTGCLGAAHLSPEMLTALTAYDNAASGLAATTIQGAIDELAMAVALGPDPTLSCPAGEAPVSKGSTWGCGELSPSALVEVTGGGDCAGTGTLVSFGHDDGDADGVPGDGTLQAGEVDADLTFCQLAAGLHLVEDIVPGGAGSHPARMTVLGSRLFFDAIDSTGKSVLMSSDGAPGGAVNLGSLVPTGHMPVAVWDKVYFRRDDGIHGTELWRTDGTLEGTELFKDIEPGPKGSFFMDFTPVASMTFFMAKTSAAGKELWVTDGTAEGTQLVLDINPGGSYSFPSLLASLDGVLILAANDGVHGRELWRSDGTAEGTYLLKDLRPGFLSSWPGPALRLDDLVYLISTTPSAALWATDGTPSGTNLIMSFGVYCQIIEMAVFGPWLLLGGGCDSAHGRELWRSDGTAEGTVMVKDIDPGPGSSGPDTFVELPGGVLFFADVSGEGRQLWKTDGTEDGTILVHGFSVPPEVPGYFALPSQVATLRGAVFFVGYDEANGMELWRTDGTSAGTHLAADIRFGPSSGAPTLGENRLVEMNGQLFFPGTSSLYGTELYRFALPGSVVIH